MKPYTKQQPVTVYDVIKQRDQARAEREGLRAERDQLRMLCQIAAHYVRYLPVRPQDCDEGMIERLEAAARGDMDVAGNPQGRSVRTGPPASSASAAPPVEQPQGVSGDRQPAPAADPGEGRSAPKDVTLTAAETKVLKALASVGGADYGSLEVLTKLPRHKVISAVHTLARFELVEREGLVWRRA